MSKLYNFSNLESYRIKKLKETIMDISTTIWGLSEEGGQNIINGLSKLVTNEVEKNNCSKCGQKVDLNNG